MTAVMTGQARPDARASRRSRAGLAGTLRSERTKLFSVRSTYYALALLVLRSLARLTVLERSRKGTGFDWWLAAEDNLFQAAARLEVSGVMRGSARRINGRLRERIAQTERSDRSGLTAYVAVIEFGGPTAKVVRR